jgi:putative membrane protein
MMWYGNGGMGPLMVLGGILMLLFWAGIIGLVVWGVATLTKRYSPGSGITEKRDAMAIAKERYARGEIGKEQFDQIKRDLS